MVVLIALGAAYVRWGLMEDDRWNHRPPTWGMQIATIQPESIYRGGHVRDDVDGHHRLAPL